MPEKKCMNFEEVLGFLHSHPAMESTFLETSQSEIGSEVEAVACLVRNVQKQRTRNTQGRKLSLSKNTVKYTSSEVVFGWTYYEGSDTYRAFAGPQRPSEGCMADGCAEKKIDDKIFCNDHACEEHACDKETLIFARFCAKCTWK